jgi:hypothetical protein
VHTRVCGDARVHAERRWRVPDVHELRAACNGCAAASLWCCRACTAGAECAGQHRGPPAALQACADEPAGQVRGAAPGQGCISMPGRLFVAVWEVIPVLGCSCCRTLAAVTAATTTTMAAPGSAVIAGWCCCRRAVRSSSGACVRPWARASCTGSWPASWTARQTCPLHPPWSRCGRAAQDVGRRACWLHRRAAGVPRAQQLLPLQRSALTRTHHTAHGQPAGPEPHPADGGRGARSARVAARRRRQRHGPRRLPGALQLLEPQRRCVCMRACDARPPANGTRRSAAPACISGSTGAWLPAEATVLLLLLLLLVVVCARAQARC